MMKTKCGREEAQRRHDYMIGFLKQIDAEFGFGDEEQEKCGEARDLEQNAGDHNIDQSAAEDSEEHEYDGDENVSSSEDTSDDDEGSPDDTWNPVVTFAESRSTNPPSRLGRPSRMRLGHPRTTKSHSALERLRQDLYSTLEPGPSANAQSGAMPESSSPRSDSLQPDELAMPPLHNIASHWLATTGNYDTTHSAGPHGSRYVHSRWNFETSDDESVPAISHLAGVDMSVIEPGGN
ncbi:hypothetical protein GGI21_006290, partial [Coemansia aciculifera]